MRRFGLSGNQLKILALIAMTCDHVGKQLLPQYPLLQIIGRVAFPIFAYLIAEGCVYTRNRKRYLGSMLLLALGCQIVYFVAMGSLYQCVLVSFSMAIALIYLLDWANRRKDVAGWMVFGVGLAAAAFVCEVLPGLMPRTDFAIDYGIWGLLLPIGVYLGKNKIWKLCLATAAIMLGCLAMGGIQWYALLAILLLALYNGTRGKWKLKYLFYIYYPAHLGVIYLISLL